MKGEQKPKTYRAFWLRFLHHDNGVIEYRSPLFWDELSKIEAGAAARKYIEGARRCGWELSGYYVRKVPDFSGEGELKPKFPPRGIR